MKNQATVPPQYKCPVCGKWGRSKTPPMVPHGYLYCNPKARTGGGGCGEIFKHIRVKGCDSISFVKEFTEQQITERMVALGFRMVQSMKDSGVHDPYLRQCKWRDVYDYHSEPNGLCDCGCGQTKIAGRRCASSKCSGVFYDVAEMIARQGKTLLLFLAKLRGPKCELCNHEPRLMGSLEIDHILEVNDGGGMCWIDNYQLLCSNCHKAKTKAYAGIRAERARAAKELEKPQSPQLSLF